MTYRTAAIFAIPWAIALVLSVVTNLDSTPVAGQSGESTRDFINTIANPNQVQVEQPTIGSNPLDWIQSPFGFALPALNWIQFMFKAAALDYPDLFSDWLLLVRFILLILAAPFLFMIIKEGLTILSQISRGAGNLAGALAKLLPF